MSALEKLLADNFVKQWESLYAYEDCVIVVTLERNTFVTQIPEELQVGFTASDQLDSFWEDSFADMRDLQPGVYFCTIKCNALEYDATIWVDDIVPAVLTRCGEVSNGADISEQGTHQPVQQRERRRLY